MTPTPLQSLLVREETVFCAFCLLPDPSAVEMLARQDWDCVFIDCQHGLIDYADMLAMTVAVQGAGKPVLVRPPLNDEGFIGKVLDAGADAVICPMINSPDDARWLARAANYPPLGERSWGPLRAVERFGGDRAAFHEHGNVLSEAWAMIETREALDNLDAILTTPGIDGIFIGPNDLCNSLTGGSELDPGHPQVLDALKLVLEKTREHKSFAAVYANTPELARTHMELGFRFIAVGSDVAFLKSGSAATLAALKG